MENMRNVVAVQNLEEMTIILKNELDNIADGFIAVGYYLKKVRDDGLYSQQGYASVYEYAGETFGISRFTASRFMEINDTYSVGGYSPQIEERFRGYGSSKLTEMLQLPENIREEVPREATVRDIRDVKTTVKETESKYEDQMELCDVAPQQEPVYNWIHQLVEVYFGGEGKSKFKEYAIWAKSNKNDQDKTMEILSRINPSKFKMIRLQNANVLMTADKIKVMPYRGKGENVEYSYNAFHVAFLDLFYPDYPDMSGAAVNVYEAFYGEPLEKTTESRPEPKKESKPEKTPKPKPVPESKKEPDKEEPTEEEMKQGEGATEETKPAAVEQASEVAENETSENPEVPGNPSTCEVLEGQMTVEDYPELMPATADENEVGKTIESIERGAFENVMNPPVEGPYMTRKAYLETLTEYGMAEYMARMMRTGNGPESPLYEKAWETWLSAKVDEKGRTDE